MTIATLPIEDAPRFQKDTRGFATRAVQAGAPHDPVTGAVIAPVTPPQLLFGTYFEMLTNSSDLTFNYIRSNQRWKPSWSLRILS